MNARSEAKSIAWDLLLRFANFVKNFLENLDENFLEFFDEKITESSFCKLFRKPCRSIFCMPAIFL